jgi:hypothetical protein
MMQGVDISSALRISKLVLALDEGKDTCDAIA